MKEKEIIKKPNHLFYFSVLVFLTTSIIHLYCCVRNLDEYRFLSKKFLMPTLLFLYFQITNKETRSTIIILALIFGSIGDYLLIYYENSKCLVMGLGSFLLGHFFYIIKIVTSIEIKLWKEGMFKALAIFILFFCFTYYLFKFHLGEGMIKGKVEKPGIMYMSTLSILDSCSIFYFINKKTKESSLVMLGSLLFSTSDFILTKQIFYFDFDYSQFMIMLTYIMAQAFLVIGLSKNKSEKYKIR